MFFGMANSMQAIKMAGTASPIYLEKLKIQYTLIVSQPPLTLGLNPGCDNMWDTL